MIGFIGAGNMGAAIINGMLSKNIDSKSLFVYEHNEKAISALKKLKINICERNVDVIQNAKYVFLAIKPDVYEEELSDINQYITKDNVIIVMAAGIDINRVKHIIGNKKVVRIMPNTPAQVGLGFTVVCFDDLVTLDEKNEVNRLLNTFGEVKEISEDYINAYSAISGSGPAYVFMMIEAMADAAVLIGIRREDAYVVVEHTIIGSAELAVQSGKHPGELKDMVCSPGGTTIEGVRTLEENAFKSSLIESIINTYKKNFDLSKIR